MTTAVRHRCGRGSRLAFASFLILAMFFMTGARARAAGLLVADGGFGGALEIKEHSAHVTINNGIAVTEVTQIFVNTESRQVEALYTFPVPRGASVSNFAMWINGKEMTGEVLEKQRARQIYNSYKQQKRDPGLLEQSDYRTFEMRVFPIGPKAEQKVQVTYAQELDFDHDWATYVYPLATQTRRVAKLAGGVHKRARAGRSFRGDDFQRLAAATVWRIEQRPRCFEKAGGGFSGDTARGRRDCAQSGAGDGVQIRRP